MLRPRFDEAPAPTALPTNKRDANAVLADLRELHRELTEEIGNMERVVTTAVPELPVYTRTRWRLSSASRRRSQVVNEAIALLPSSGRALSSAVAALTRDGAMLARMSSEHTQRWSLEATLADWSGYGRASGDIRLAMRRRIQQEKATLYPLLMSLTAAD